MGLSLEHRATAEDKAGLKCACFSQVSLPKKSVSCQIVLPKASTLLISNISIALRKGTWRLLLIYLLLSPTDFCLFSLTSTSWELKSRGIRFQLNMCFTVLKCARFNRVSTNISEGQGMNSTISIKEYWSCKQ